MDIVISNTSERPIYEQISSQVKEAILSGGEKQRISIARAILKDAPIIIFDEATANVDPENEDRLQQAMEALTKAHGGWKRRTKKEGKRTEGRGKRARE